MEEGFWNNEKESSKVLGRIKEITTDEITKSQYAIIKPVEDFEFIREVFVITNFEKISR